MSLSGSQPEQISLPLGRDERDLLNLLQQITGRKISLTITDNAASMISSTVKGEGVCLRLHRMFLSADDQVVREIAKFIHHRGCKTPLIRRYIRENSGLLRSRPLRIVRIKTTGRHHDLVPIFSHLNDLYFGGGITALITWVKKKKGWAVRLRTLGSYSSHTNTIRINSVLDSRSVPGYFLEFVVYHEMLHADMGTEKKNGRRIVHSRSFRQRERLFRDYERALAWEKRWTGRDRP